MATKTFSSFADLKKSEPDWKKKLAEKTDDKKKPDERKSACLNG